MRFLAAALFSALGLAPTCAKHLKIPVEHPAISSTRHGSIVGGAGGGNDGGTVIVARQLLAGRPSLAQRSAEAMFPAMASFAFAGAAVVRGGNVGGSNGGGNRGCRGGGGNSGVRHSGGGFPGPVRIVRPDMHEHLVVFFMLMAEWGGHIETGAHS